MRIRLLIAVFCLSSVCVHAETVSLPVQQDTYISLTAPTTNYSTAISFVVARQSGNTPDRIALLLFDISRVYGIGSARILSAKLKLHRATGTGTENGGQLGRVDAPWDGATVVWNNAPAYTDISGEVWSSASGEGYNTVIDVTTFVQNWAGGQWANYGLTMRMFGIGGYGGTWFDTKEETAVRGLPPVIEVEVDGSLTGERVVPVNIVHDSYIDPANAATNYGSLNQLYVARDTTPNRQTYLQFELTGLTGIDPNSIESATLKLHRAAVSGGETSGLLGRVTGAWDESTITWNSAPTVTETDNYTWNAASGDGYNTSIDVTDVVKKWKDGTWPNYGLRMRLASGAYNLMIFDSSEETTRNLRPVIEVKLKTYGSFDVPWWIGSVGTPALYTDGNGNIWKFCEVVGRDDEHLKWSCYNSMKAVLVGSERYWQGINAAAKFNTEGRLGRISGFYESYVSGKYSKRYDGAIVLQPLVPGLYSWYGQVYCRIWSYVGPLRLEFVRFAENDFPTLLHTEIIEESSVYVPITVDLSTIAAVQNISVRQGERLAMVARAENFGAHVVAEFQTPVGITISRGGCAETTKMAGDLNGDCAVDMKDIGLFLQHWLECSETVDARCY